MPGGCRVWRAGPVSRSHALPKRSSARQPAISCVDPEIRQIPHQCALASRFIPSRSPAAQSSCPSAPGRSEGHRLAYTLRADNRPKRTHSQVVRKRTPGKRLLGCASLYADPTHQMTRLPRLLTLEAAATSTLSLVAISSVRALPGRLIGLPAGSRALRRSRGASIRTAGQLPLVDFRKQTISPWVLGKLMGPHCAALRRVTLMTAGR